MLNVYYNWGPGMVKCVGPTRCLTRPWYCMQLKWPYGPFVICAHAASNVIGGVCLSVCPHKVSKTTDQKLM